MSPVGFHCCSSSFLEEIMRGGLVWALGRTSAASFEVRGIELYAAGLPRKIVKTYTTKFSVRPEKEPRVNPRPCVRMVIQFVLVLRLFDVWKCKTKSSPWLLENVSIASH